METDKARRRIVAIVLAAAAVAAASPATAGCGCDKPPPPRTAIRPFVAFVDQQVTLFDDRLAPGQAYDVQFTSTADGRSDWSRGRAMLRRDLADGQFRSQLRVRVADVSLGPCRVSVWSGGVRLYDLDEDGLTVTAPPIALHDFSEAVTREGFTAGVGKDGTLYIAVDVGQVSEATTFSGMAYGLPLRFSARSVTVYNAQGFLMQLLDPSVPGLFRLAAGSATTSDRLDYWRHEFRTYKEAHRKVDARRTDDDVNWHADGSYHVDHDHLVVAISGLVDGGTALRPGATPPFELVVTSTPTAAL